MTDPLDDFDDNLQPVLAAKGKKGGKQSGKKGETHTTVVTRQTYIGEEAEKVAREDKSNDEGTFNAIFDAEEVEERAIVKIRVYRKDPNEGFLGYLEDPSATLVELGERWGGSFYRLDGVNHNGKVVNVKTIKVAGDPIFVSATFEQTWRRSRGLPPRAADGAIAAPAGNAIDLPTIMSLMQEREAARSKESEERDERRRRDEREAAQRMRQLELEAQAKQKADEDDRERRRQKDQDEREERRRKDDHERDERRRADAATAEQRQQQFFAQMIGMVKESSAQAIAMVTAKSEGNKGEGGLMESLKVIAAIKETFGGDSGGGGSGEKEDMASLIVKHGPEWLASAGNAIGGAIREVKGGGAEGGNAGTSKSQGALGAMPLGSLQPKVETLIEKIIAKGGDPEKVLGKVLDNLIAVSDGKLVASNKPNATPPAQAAASGTVEAPPVAAKPVRVAKVGEKVGGTQTVSFP